ncbi:MAG: phage tail tube protein [Bilophila sp.]
MAVTIASGANHGVRYVKETTSGTTPATPVMLELKNTGCSFNLTRDTLTSNTIRSDRQIADVRTGTDKVGGSLDAELCGAEHDALLEAALAGTWTGNVLKAGKVPHSFTFERAYTDIGQYMRFVGCYVNQLTLAVKPNAFVTASFEVVGLTAGLSATPLSATPTASKTTEPFDTFTGTLKIGTQEIAVVTGVDLTLANGVEAKYPVMSRSAIAVGWGKSNLSGTLSAFFTDDSLTKKFINDEKTSLEFTLTRDGYAYAFLVPKILFTGADAAVQGESEISLNVPFQAVLDPVLATNIQITRTVPAPSGV